MNDTMRRASVPILIAVGIGLAGAATAGYPVTPGTWSWGAGGAAHFEADSFGLQGKGIYGLNDMVRLSPSATLFFNDTWLSLDGDVHFVFPLEEDNPVLYGLVGLEIATDFDFTEVGLNLGAGLNARLSESLGGYVEFKYVISDLDGLVLSVGVLF